MDTALYMFFIYLAIIFGVGIYCTKYSNDLTGYLVGDRKMGPWLLGLAYFATYLSSSAMVGNAGTGYKSGLAFMFQPLMQTLALPIGLIIFAAGLAKASKQLGVITVPDYLKKRYRSRIPSAFLACIMVIFLIPYMIGVTKGAAITLQVVTGLSFEVSVWVVCGVTAIYMVLGGFMASAITDVIQGFLMCFGATLVFIVALVALGGPTNIANNLAALDPGLIETPGTMGWSELIGVSFVFGIAPWGLPQLVQKCFAMRDKRVIKPAAIIVTILACFILFTSNANGIMARAMFGNQLLENADMAFPRLTILLLHPILQGLVLGAVAAAAMSTLDGVILVASSAASRDLYQSCINKDASDKQVLLLTRIVSVIIMCITAVLTLQQPDMVMYLSIFSHSMMASTVMAPIWFGIFYKKATLGGCIASQLSGAFTAFVWFQLKNRPFDMHPIMASLLVAFIVMWIFCKFTKPLPESFVKQLFPEKAK